jgi:hypothetical protein
MLILPMLLGVFRPLKPGNTICCNMHLTVIELSSVSLLSF